MSAPLTPRLLTHKLPAAVLLGAAALTVAAATIPLVRSSSLETFSKNEADEALARLADRERKIAAQFDRFQPFGPSAAERTAVLGRIDLDPATENFTFDGLLEADGRLRLRAVSSVDAVRAGRAAPGLHVLDLPQPQLANGSAAKDPSP